MPEFIDALNIIVVNEGVNSSSACRKGLHGIRSCPADMDILLVEINL